MSILSRLTPYGKVLVDEPMKKHTTYRIGGTVAYYIMPENETALMCIFDILNEENIPFHVIGIGSNILWDDDHFSGAIINLDKTLNEYYFEPDGILVAQAGCSIINLSIEAMKRSLTGFEFASGIPGSIGGGLFMNAGAYKSNLSNLLIDVCVLRDGKIEWIKKEDLEYGYRHSLFQSHRDWTILAGRFQLEKGNQEDIRDLMASRRERRMASQPLEMPCAGSVFRNPESIPAWKLIEDMGFRGYQLGGAKVSEKHCNFIVNATGEARSKDVHDLITCIQTKAKEEYGIDLITEVESFHW